MSSAFEQARNVTHASFTIQRVFPQNPARVFRAFADPKAKAKWFHGPVEDWSPEVSEMDFRVGGQERSVGSFHGGEPHIFTAVYQDIVPDERIVFSYDMQIGTRRISVSLTTIEFFPEGPGTHMVFTEQGAFLDGWDDANGRERGTIELMEQLARALMD